MPSGTSGPRPWTACTESVLLALSSNWGPMPNWSSLPGHWTRLNTRFSDGERPIHDGLRPKDFHFRHLEDAPPPPYMELDARVPVVGDKPQGLFR